MSLLLEYMTEEELVDTLLGYGKQGGWLCTHFRPAKTNKGYRTPIQGDKGYFDITMMHEELRRTLFIECKSKSGSLQPDQKRWRAAALVMPGSEYYLWKPKDLPVARQVILGHRTNRKAQWG